MGEIEATKCALIRMPSQSKDLICGTPQAVNDRISFWKGNGGEVLKEETFNTGRLFVAYGLKDDIGKGCSGLAIRVHRKTPPKEYPIACSRQSEGTWFNEYGE